MSITQQLHLFYDLCILINRILSICFGSSSISFYLLFSRYPYNAEGNLAELRDSWITPAGKHFVRNHCAVPDIDPDEYTLTITGEGMTETVLSLEDLKTKFPKVDVTTVIQCNGNRREDFHYLGIS